MQAVSRVQAFEAICSPGLADSPTVIRSAQQYPRLRKNRTFALLLQGEPRSYTVGYITLYGSFGVTNLKKCGHTENVCLPVPSAQCPVGHSQKSFAGNLCSPCPPIEPDVRRRTSAMACASRYGETEYGVRCTQVQSRSSYRRHRYRDYSMIRCRCSRIMMAYEPLTVNCI